MTLFEYYLQYMTRICEGSLETPEGITLTETDEVRRAMELQQQVGAMGIPAFVRACAAAAGDEIPREAYDNFSMDDALSAARVLTEQARLYVMTGDAGCMEGYFEEVNVNRNRESRSKRSRTRMRGSTPSRCFWTASLWMTDWCSTSSRC